MEPIIDANGTPLQDRLERAVQRVKVAENYLLELSIAINNAKHTLKYWEERVSDLQGRIDDATRSK